VKALSIEPGSFNGASSNQRYVCSDSQDAKTTMPPKTAALKNSSSREKRA
jgi:hypothetical protein